VYLSHEALDSWWNPADNKSRCKILLHPKNQIRKKIFPPKNTVHFARYLYGIFDN